MDNQWKEETCDNCDFMIEGKCRKFPPEQTSPRKHVTGETGSYVNEAVFDYPDIKNFTKACSCWREKQSG